MPLYVALQAVPARRHTLFPPILAATAPLAHAAVASCRVFRPSAVEAATATSTTRATRTTSRCPEETPLPIGQMDLIPDQVQPVSTRTGESTNSASDSTPLPGGLQRPPPGETLRSQHKREMQRLPNDPRSSRRRVSPAR